MDRQLARRSRSTTLPRAVLRAAGFLLLFTACHHRPESDQPVARIPRDAARFTIAVTDDSTVVFRPFEARWLRVGMRGHAVDPTQRDALIARLTIVRIDTGGVAATITGKVSEVATTHVVLVVRPRASWRRDHRFWTGAMTGLIVGVVTALVAR